MSNVKANQQPSVAMLTPTGNGGIAVIRVCGPGAERVVGKVFVARSKMPWANDLAGRLYYGHVCDRGQTLDEVIVCRKSPTEFEINCHGGIVAAGETVRLLVRAGGEELSSPTAWAEAGDAIQREAAAALPGAVTRLAARMLCDQWNGALTRAIRSIDLASAGAREALSALLATAPLGQALLTPRRVVLAGRPNVGKSTLFNALVGHNRTLVSPTAGTTRDYISECVSLRGFPVELIDSAGLREAGEIIESLGVSAARKVAAAAHIVVLVADSQSPASPESGLPGEVRNPIMVLNKSDLEHEGIPQEHVQNDRSIRISALHRQGLRELEDAIMARMPSASPVEQHGAVVFTERQVSIIKELIDAVGSRETPRATSLRESLLT
jgi:tRNA modification GTPase